MSLFVLGSINVDLVVRGKTLPQPGETVGGGVFYRAFGGKGANQAVAAARLGTPVKFVGAIGNDEFGSQSLSSLNREGIDISLVRRTAAATGIALILVDASGRNLISVASGANLELTASDVDQLPADLFRAGDIFLTCFESPLDAVQAGLRRARAAGMVTVLNPAPALGCLDSALASLVDWIIPNQQEASVLSGIPAPAPFQEPPNALGEASPTDLQDARQAALQAAERLRQLGCRAAIVTMGEAGGVVSGLAGFEQFDAIKVTAVDTTAAGDAFCGAFAAGLSRSFSAEASIRLAAKVAALAVTRFGAQPSLPTAEEVARVS